MAVIRTDSTTGVAGCVLVSLIESVTVSVHDG